MGRKPCCEKVGLRRGPWTAEEDGKLVSYIANNGICCWRAIPKLAGLLRCGKSCRLRWTNYLRPDLKRGIFTEAEENLILELHATLGNRWSRIAAQLPGRTDNEIKNYWNTRLKKRLRSQGLDPNTHLPVDSTKGGEDDDDDGEDSTSDGDVASATNVKKKAAPPQVKVRQPKGPKPQLKLSQSKEGQFVLTSTVPGGSSNKAESESEDSGGSTVTEAEGELIARKLSTAPSFPQAELWNCIKPAAAPFPAATDELLSDWDSYIMQSAEYVAESNVSDVCIQEMEWTMDSELTPPELTHVPVLAPIPDPSEHLQIQQSQELQRLATLLDLI